MTKQGPKRGRKPDKRERVFNSHSNNNNNNNNNNNKIKSIGTTIAPSSPCPEIWAIGINAVPMQSSAESLSLQSTNGCTQFLFKSIVRPPARPPVRPSVRLSRSISKSIQFAYLPVDQLEFYSLAHCWELKEKSNKAQIDGAREGQTKVGKKKGKEARIERKKERKKESPT